MNDVFYSLQIENYHHKDLDNIFQQDSEKELVLYDFVDDADIEDKEYKLSIPNFNKPLSEFVYKTHWSLFYKVNKIL